MKHGDSSEVFSFGVVVLEVLTGRLTSVENDNLYEKFIEEKTEELASAFDGRVMAACPAPPGTHTPEWQCSSFGQPLFGVP